MPTVVSYMRSNAFRLKDNGEPVEGELYNTITNLWEEPNVIEKERLLGFQLGEKGASGVRDVQRAVRLGRALNTTTMR